MLNYLYPSSSFPNQLGIKCNLSSINFGVIWWSVATSLWTSQKFLDFEQLVAAHCFIVFKVLASQFESFKTFRDMCAIWSSFWVSGFHIFLWPFSWVQNKIYCLLMFLHGQGKQSTPGTATFELTRTFSLISVNCNLNWQEQATFGFCNKPYFHDSINPGMLFVKQATEMLWLNVVLLSFGRMG